ncbi:Tat pathway signal protein [Sphingomonas antarctica]|uniref:DUF885 domain-containing protein n=1 Tax=Sphingomonas antarctica TaxID=2040274 RepID=UPI0039EA7661
MKISALAPLALLAVSVSGLAIAAPVTTAPRSAHDRLFAFFHASDEQNLKDHPQSAIYRGDLRYANQLGDNFSDAAGERDYRQALKELAQARAYNRRGLDATDNLALDVFIQQREIDARGSTPAMRALTTVRPMNHFYSFYSGYADFASGQGAAPFNTLADYDSNIARHKQVAAQIDTAIAQFRKGMKTGVVQPKLVVRNMVDQLDLILKDGPDNSVFMGPLKKFPAGISAADQARVTAETKAVVAGGIFPAYTRLRDFLRGDYLPVARDSVGLSGMPGGDKLYAYMIEANTTLPLTADYVHNLGLSEVARITAGMDAIRVKTGFKGDLHQFFAFLNSDPRFTPGSRDDMRDRFVAIGKRVDVGIPALFSTIPKSPLAIRPVPPYREKTDAAGSYEQGTPDGARPGTFYYNAYDLPARFTWGFETLYLHEAIPGHHFQISLAQENAELPNFMRFGGNTAFVEGWALYSETLWPDLHMETDPYQRFGGLNDEMLRAMRLVVDTGIHAKGWTRDQAIKYMRDNSSMSLTDATAEVERYIAIPGQALGYKLGQLTFLRLKAKARADLGSRFDIRKFHAQCLDTGALPLPILEKKIDAWIAGGGK